MEPQLLALSTLLPLLLGLLSFLAMPRGNTHPLCCLLVVIFIWVIVVPSLFIINMTILWIAFTDWAMTSVIIILAVDTMFMSLVTFCCINKFMIKRIGDTI